MEPLRTPIPSNLYSDQIRRGNRSGEAFVCNLLSDDHNRRGQGAAFPTFGVQYLSPYRQNGMDVGTARYQRNHSISRSAIVRNVVSLSIQ